jgi:hypothetical protein
MTITIVMTFELNFYVLPTEVLIMAISIFCIFDRMVLLRAKKVGHQISVSFEKFDVVQALLSFFLTLFQLTV